MVLFSLVFRWPLFMCMAAHVVIPYSRPVPLNITFNLLDTTAAFCSDLWYVLRSSTNNGCVIFWLGLWDKLYPSVLLKYYTIGFRARVKNLPQKESPCNIFLFTLMGPIFSLPSLVFTSSVILHFFMTDLISFIRLNCIPCISSVSSNPLNCRISSSFVSVHLRIIYYYYYYYYYY